MENSIIRELKRSVLDGDKEAAIRAAERSLSSGLNPLDALDEGLMKGVLEMGDRYGKQEAFLTDLILSSEAMQAAIAVLKPRMKLEEVSKHILGKLVLGTVQGDIHDIGKNIVATLLEASGFEVTDLGIDVPPMRFVERAEELYAQVIAASALLSTTRPFQRDIVTLLRDMKLRNKYKVLVGGAGVTPEWAKEIGADAYGRDGPEAVRVAKEITRAE